MEIFMLVRTEECDVDRRIAGRWRMQEHSAMRINCCNVGRTSI